MPLPDELRKVLAAHVSDEVTVLVRWEPTRRILIELSQAQRVLAMSVEEAIELASLLLLRAKQATEAERARGGG